MVNKLTILKAIEPMLANIHEKMHLADLSRQLNMPHPTLRLWLNALEKEGILKKDIRGRQTLYCINTKHPNIIDYLIITEKNKVIEACQKNLELRELIETMHKSMEENTKALIFGSAAINYNKAEDVDILLIQKKQIKVKFRKKLHIISLPNLKMVSKTLKEEIKKKHLIISGSEDIIRWLVWQQ